MATVANQISERKFSNAYLLYGAEAFLRNHYKKALTLALTNPDDTLNYAYYEGKEIDPDEVAGLVETMPFMAEYRVIVVENSGWFAKSGGKDEDSEGSEEEEVAASGKTARLQEAIKNIGLDVVIIFVEEKIDKRSKLYKAISAKGTCEEYAEQNEDTLAKWVANRAKSEGRLMDRDTAYYLVAEIGKDMLMLGNELDKLIAYTYGREYITRADVDEVCTHQVTNKIFDMIAAIVAHRQEEALRLYYDLLTLREAPFHILALMQRQYTQMLEVRDCLDNGESIAQIASKLGAKDWLVRRLSDSVRKTGKKTIKAYLEECCKADEAIKTGNLTDMMSVELLIVSCSGKR